MDVFVIVDTLNSLMSKIERLEEEQRETDNLLYELSNSIDAIDRRIDIIVEEYQLKENV